MKTTKIKKPKLIQGSDKLAPTLQINWLSELERRRPMLSRVRKQKLIRWQSVSRTLLATLIALTLTQFLSGCGGTAFKETPPQNQNPGGSSGGGGGSSGGGGGGGGGGTTSGWDPNYTFSFSMAGDGSYTTPDINTDTILKIKLKPGSAGVINVPGYGFQGVYNCISYNITAVGSTKTSDILKAPGANNGGVICPNSNEEQIIDFSNRLTPGHGPVNIKIDHPQYDFYYYVCLNEPWNFGVQYPYYYYYNYYQPYCKNGWGMHAVYRTHTVTGTLEVQVNGTGGF